MAFMGNVELEGGELVGKRPLGMSWRVDTDE
jgi:hypothetical protein